MTALPAPRLRGPIVASILLHGGLIAAVVLLRPPPPPPTPPIYRVQLIAAPAGERAVGVVQDQPPTAEPVEKTTPTPPPPAKAVPTPKLAAPTKAKPKPTPKAVTQVPNPDKSKTAQAKPAGGGETGGKGADVANVNTPGIDFPYPGYINNVARQILLRFRPVGNYTATVRFVIRRDGTVDPNSIAISEHAQSWNFEQAALAAVEAAANAKAFGPLPGSFNEDILPVQFRFTPSMYR
ncbi:MAG TPA: TonB C-terminal domain-containing protein [Gemmatimonadaceae bacterium]|nr:TonB C-terminal domain-containing protein [Gemmatimonadaceae bacterium]